MLARKAYIALFALIYVISDLSTAALLAAFRHFIADDDNDITFNDAANELNRIYESIALWRAMGGNRRVSQEPFVLKYRCN